MMVREAVDLPRLKRVAAPMGCPYCHGTVSQVDTTQNSLVWYCANCDIHHQTTPRGVLLRSYRKDAETIINIPLPEGG